MQALVIDQDQAHTAALSELLSAQGCEVTLADKAVVKGTPDIAFVSIDVPGFELDLLSDPALEASAEVIVMAEEDDARVVHECMTRGATYFFCKPFDPDFLKPLLRDIASEIAASEKTAEARDVPVLDQFGRLRGSSPPMRRLFRILRKVAPTGTSVLITGESGTGKELVAQTLHEMSDVADGPFLAMNCAAIPNELLESELFGHEKGSFSGADKQHHGFFERAEGGTLFMDELGEMPLDLQAKLLRVLESGGYRRVGGETDLRSTARVIAATNRDPQQAIADGLLREDLYYRIARFPITLPALVARSSDIPGLAQFFLDELNTSHSAAVSLAPATIDALVAHTWPGNVRELRSAIEQAYVLADTEITPGHLPDFDNQSIGERIEISVGETIEDAERKLILATLAAHDGDRQRAAQTLGISVRTLYNRLNQYDAEEAERPGKD